MWYKWYPASAINNVLQTLQTELLYGLLFAAIFLNIQKSSYSLDTTQPHHHHSKVTTLEDIWSIMVNSNLGTLNCTVLELISLPSHLEEPLHTCPWYPPNSILLLLPAFASFQTMLRYISFFPRCCLICKLYSHLTNLKVYTNYTSKSKTENKQEILFSRFKSY